jgi:ABC-type antimicrobial peptide transport system permease subunit
VTLGATRGDVMGMVLGSAAWLVTAGLLLGAPAAFWSQRAAASLLENLPSGGVVPIGVACAAMVAVAVVAAYVPARRATRVEPVIALRAE